MDVVTFILDNFSLFKSFEDKALLTRNYFQNKILTNALHDANIHVDSWINVKSKLNTFENVQMYFFCCAKGSSKEEINPSYN